MHTEAELRPLLTEVADQGWAEVEQELEIGLSSLAAPIRDVDGAVVTAINVSTTGGDRRRAPGQRADRGRGDQRRPGEHVRALTDGIDPLTIRLRVCGNTTHVGQAVGIQIRMAPEPRFPQAK